MPWKSFPWEFFENLDQLFFKLDLDANTHANFYEAVFFHWEDHQILAIEKRNTE
jgi:hypothetical protein